MKHFTVAVIPLYGDNYSGFKNKLQRVLKEWASWPHNMHPYERYLKISISWIFATRTAIYSLYKFYYH